jgi:hypothetical protein
MKNVIFILVFAFPGLSGCWNSSDPNQLDSNDYDTIEKRVKILKKEIKSFSNFKNAEFELFNVNGFSNSRTLVPGTSSIDYKFAIKTNPADVDKWINGMTEIEPEDYDDLWIKKMIEKRENVWKTNTQPKFYTRKGDNVMMIVYKSDGIIFKRVIDN